MRDYNWKSDWWVDGMSMMCLAHLFCSANALTLYQFRRFFDVNKKQTSNTTYNYSVEKTSFDLGRLLRGIGVDPEHGPMLFPSKYRVSHNWGEVRGVLKVCPVCLKQGIHLSVHQLAWMIDCPVHNEPLLRACRCGELKYTLTPKSKNGDALCRCGEFRFGSFVPFSQSERKTLNRHLRAIEKLQLALPHGFDQYRVSTDEVDRAEYRTQLSLMIKVSRVLLDDVPHNANLSKLRREAVDICRRDFTESRRERFRWFCKHAMKYADDSSEDWTAALVGRLIEEEYFSFKGLSEMDSFMQRNGCTHGLRDEDIPVLQEIFSMRLLECVARGAKPIRRSLHPDLRLAMRMVGEPLCQIVWQAEENGARLKGTAYWLDDDEYWPDGEWPWLFYLSWSVIREWHECGNGYRYQIEALEGKMDEPAFVEMFDRRDAQLTESGCRQLRLFNWLE